MRKRRKHNPKFEQLELFAEKPNRPHWNYLPSKTKRRVRELLGQILVEHIEARCSLDDRKEVVRER